MLRRADAALRGFCLFALSGLLAGCGGEVPKPETQRIVILTNAVSPFWEAADKGAQDAAKELRLGDAKLSIDFQKNNKGTEGQIDRLRQLAGANDVAGLAISVSDPGNGALIAEMKKLRDQGVKVVTIDSDVDREKSRDARFAYLGTDNVVGGRELGRTAKGLVPGGGKYASFVGYKSQGNAIERNQGFAEGAGPEFEQVAWLGDEVDEVVARKNVRTALDENADLKVLVGIWSYNTPAIIDVVGELAQDDPSIRERVTVVGFDADPPSITGMEQKKVQALVVQNPYQMGYQGTRLLKALLDDDQKVIKEMFPRLEEDKEAGDIYDTGLKVIVPDETSPLKKEMFEPGTEFLMFAEFQEWLNKYGLTGS